ncbi:hypothetical protein PV755_09280 [Streptomyces caniscabiei]|uniref:Uncharacterized protein n=1 Tax=Streptomyces caniscabiei TaxID=2746961 RepID=A0A927KY15_9ACTN|nr:hypothetical protein [Streptomyces caniscabiei]MBD9721922.1 hypothetical protein [Streptomyces caniscabiei]MDX3509113.1 hypothetical protein [Streptomyces caniscabiei]MDX3717134.1 hypothetical protein [Streptomyces caniscabiei]WEO23001.1 hypothetical protein IHE65_07445 [Streptomyces caniscabiei]
MTERDEAAQAGLSAGRLDEIDARHNAATPGPWGAYEFGGGTAIDIAADLTDTGTGYRARREICRLEDEPLDNDPTHREWTAEEDWAQVQADAAFIAHAPEDVRLLLDEVRHLRSSQLAEAADIVDAMLTAEPDHTRASALYEALLKLRAQLPCTCARSQGLHEKQCRRYVPGHDLLSPVRALAAYRAERPTASVV